MKDNTNRNDKTILCDRIGFVSGMYINTKLGTIDEIFKIVGPSSVMFDYKQPIIIQTVEVGDEHSIETIINVSEICFMARNIKVRV